ncbi:LPXTG cell wall anchor domain-containing protein [Glutamicibacter mishrai]|uniref:LPXTG cell wall anchor domain-containing protein n=1 Tax=Glutamicibacter mishrai TaxID=1775880 RepID=A0A6H0SMQ0_9MICC|nr:LPXTG cell wall anchor domain-containing protein [Glutamicibacter mishrai]QIV88406.1 LPXTG cell wall anchor domain-containing protein [Glutamicibacter mishrai]
MPNPNKKTAQRGIVAAAATALVVGSSFMPAVAAPEATSSPSASASSSESATPSATTTEGAVDTTGLPEAIERDLDKTVDEYLEDSKASETAAAVSKQLKEKGIDSRASVKDGKAKVEVSEKDAAEAKKVAAASQAAVSLDINKKKLSTPEDVYGQIVENVDESELTRLTAIVNTVEDGKEVVKIIASGPGSIEGSKKETYAKKSAAEGELSLEEFAEEVASSDVVFEPSKKDGRGAAKHGATEDIYGGMGYAIAESGQDPASRCSVGFNAWDPSGKDAILSAGHCTADNSMTDTYVLEANAPNDFLGYTANLGTFGFGQFGGPGNSGYAPGTPISETDTENPGTDISVIEDINPALNLKAGVSQWPSGGDERDQVINVTGDAAATIGANACSSGATTGWSCSTITGEGIFYVQGMGGTIRDVWGYTADNPDQSVLDQGDSGGAVLVGSKAVGINSANSGGEDGVENTSDDLAFYTGLTDALQRIDGVKGYTVKVFINAPTLTTENGSEVEAGSDITGNVKDAAPGTKVDVIVNGEVVDTVTVDSNGNFTFSAPDQTGVYEFTLQAHKGFDKSATTDGKVVVIAVPEPTPTPTPTATPTEEPSETPTEEPSETPTEEPSETPTEEPSETPTATPSETPTEEPSETPTEEPSETPTATPSETPTEEPSETPTEEPSETPTATPSETPTEEPSETPTEEPSETPTATPSETPTEEPSESASETEESSEAPQDDESDEPTKSATPKETPKKDDPLADTGSSSAPLIAAGGALALVGAMFLLFRRGNRRHG